MNLRDLDGLMVSKVADEGFIIFENIAARRIAIEQRMG